LTIAICFLTSEGVVLGADSTATYPADASGDTFVHLDHQQKVLEVGESSTIGLVHWGYMGFSTKSLRTMTAELGDRVKKQKLSTARTSVAEVARTWASMVDAEYRTHVIDKHAPKINRLHDLHKEAKRRLIEKPIGARLVDTEQAELARLQSFVEGLRLGFFIGGYTEADRTPRAFEIRCDPERGVLEPVEFPELGHRIGGETSIAERIHTGIDPSLGRLLNQLAVGAELQPEVKRKLAAAKFSFGIPPIRESIDFVHSVIHATIRAIKFSGHPQTCGGPIEIAVITSDRNFRWVRHKSFDSAINDGVGP
jgi:hypothetical protein